MTPLETEANPNILVGPLRWGRALRGEAVGVRGALQGYVGQSVAEQCGRGVALGRMMRGLCSAFKQLDAQAPASPVVPQILEQ